MLTLLSPAKTLDFESEVNSDLQTEPVFLEDSELLVQNLKTMTAAQLSRLMKISNQLGELNASRYQRWTTAFTRSQAKQAVMAFKGDVYTGLEAEQFSADDIRYAQDHLRILSGLYGVLKPMDLIQAYRLEMGTKLENPRGQNLYAFWGDRITRQLNSEIQALGAKAIVNLASKEYFKALKPKLLEAEVITPFFKDYKNGEYKIISFYAKKARGLMASYIVKNQISDSEGLKKFSADGYQFDHELSSTKELLFKRKL